MLWLSRLPASSKLVDHEGGGQVHLQQAVVEPERADVQGEARSALALVQQQVLVERIIGGQVEKPVGICQGKRGTEQAIVFILAEKQRRAGMLQSKR